MSGTIPKLATLAAIALLLALWIGIQRQPETTAPALGAAVPGLEEGINDLTTLRLIGAGAKPIATLVRTDGGWTVTEKDAYPADVGKLRELLLKLLGATLLEAKTTVATSYAKLGVENISGADAKGVQVELDGLKQPVKLIVGKVGGRGGDSTYVRAAGDPQSWLAKGNITIDRTPAAWLARELVDIPASRIQSVSINGRDGKTLRVFKNAATEPNYQVADVPKDRKLSSESVANELAAALSALSIEDVLKADAAPPPVDTEHVQARFQAFDGLRVTAQIWQAESRHYARFECSLDEAIADALVQATPAETDGNKAQAPTPATTSGATVIDTAQERVQNLRQESEALKAKFAGWTFIISADRYENLSQTKEDLLEPLSDDR
ncbi:MAG: DUF4340 domain-containing protein [Panacagrimonas sp.]